MTILNAGLLNEAERVDLIVRHGPSKKQVKQGVDAEGHTAKAEENLESESIEAYRARLQKWVQYCLERVKREQKDVNVHDNYKSALLYEARRKTIRAFLATIAFQKKCSNCGAYVSI